MSNQTEEQQIEAAKTNPQCFEPLYLKYYEQILRFVYKRVELLDDSREVTAIIFTKALVGISKYKNQGFPFSSWLFRIAINEINQFYRHSKKTRAISIDEKTIKYMANEVDVKTDERIAILKKALLHLSREDLLLIELRYFEERPFLEISHILQITESNAKIKTYRVLDKLKDIYSKID